MSTILIVEDNPSNLELVRQLLEDDYTILEATDGLQAVGQATEHLPDLILMDLSLPRLDGWEATRRLRLEPATRDIPIIALTAHALRGDEERALEMGCNAYLSKPIDEDKLVECVRRWIARAR